MEQELALRETVPATIQSTPFEPGGFTWADSSHQSP